MHPLLIVLIAVFSALLFFFIVYLFLIKPRGRRKETEKFKTVRYAHRGLHDATRPENSLSAFRAAIDAGFGIELDVRLSSDGELVVFHDDTLDRMTKEKGRVDSKTLAELKSIKLLDSADTVPTFREVLELIDGRVPLLVEIKETVGKYDVTEKCIPMLKEYKGEFLIETFNPLALARVKKLMPETVRGILSSQFHKDKKFKGISYFLAERMLLNFLCRPDFVAYRHSDYKSISLKLTRGMFGAATFAYTIASREDEEKAYKHGFDGVIFEGYIPDKTK